MTDWNFWWCCTERRADIKRGRENGGRDGGRREAAEITEHQGGGGGAESRYECLGLSRFSWPGTAEPGEVPISNLRSDPAVVAAAPQPQPLPLFWPMGGSVPELKN